MSQYKIFLIGAEDEEFGILSASERDDTYHIEFAYRGRSITAEASDYFEALCQIRLELEKERLLPFCYGASLNVYPSEMARQMGGALKAYRLQRGKHARTQDLVDIFAEGPDVTPCFVSLQREFLKSG